MNFDDFILLFLGFSNVVAAYALWGIRDKVLSLHKYVNDIIVENSLEKQDKNPVSDVEIHNDLGRRLLEIQRGRYSRLQRKG